MKNINKFTLLTLLLLAMTTVMSNVAIVTSLPHLKEYFKHTANIEFYSRLMLTLPSLAIALLAPVLGHIIFRFGKKKSVLIALFFFSFFGTAGLYLDSIETLLASRALFGLCVATLMIVSTSLVGDYFKEEERHQFMAYQSAFMALGGVFFVVGGGMLSDMNWRFPFGIYFIGILLIPFVLKNIKEIKIEDMQEDETVNISKNILFVYFLAFFYMLLFFILPTQFPFLLIEKFKVSGSYAGTIIATAFFFNALGAIVFSKLKKIYSYSTIYIIGLTLIAFGLSLVGIITNVHFFFISAPILGFSGGFMMTNAVAWMLSKTNPKKRVKSSGYFTSSIFLGQFLSPIVFHPLVAIFEIQKFFSIIGASLFVIVLLVVIIKKVIQR
jgi:MFS family permease|tara:strand:- start:79282 stop:80430 length:1149 start_codon:yes stop_codon:yes gene_type:complete